MRSLTFCAFLSASLLFVGGCEETVSPYYAVRQSPAGFAAASFYKVSLEDSVRAAGDTVASKPRRGLKSSDFQAGFDAQLLPFNSNAVPPSVSALYDTTNRILVFSANALSVNRTSASLFFTIKVDSLKPDTIYVTNNLSSSAGNGSLSYSFNSKTQATLPNQQALTADSSAFFVSSLDSLSDFRAAINIKAFDLNERRLAGTVIARMQGEARIRFSSASASVDSLSKDYRIIERRGSQYNLSVELDNAAFESEINFARIQID
jgi:hypothetical protein